MITPRTRLVAGWIAVIVAFVVVITAAAALSFSVRVDGPSMQPTLSTGDRLLPNLLDRHDIHRFGLVEAVPTGGGAPGIPIVKRVIAMPGDQVRVSGGATARVWLRPGGTGPWYRVDNPAWVGRSAGNQRPCCTVTGEAGEAARTVTVPADRYWLIGDNWSVSEDSRTFGFVPASQIRAPLDLRLWPLSRFGSVGGGVRLAKAAHTD